MITFASKPIGQIWKTMTSSEYSATGAQFELFKTHSNRLLLHKKNAGVWYSDDNGATWTQSNKTSGTGLRFCEVKYSNRGQIAYRLIIGDNNSSTHAIWYSEDDGVTWTKSTDTFTGLDNLSTFYFRSFFSTLETTYNSGHSVVIAGAYTGIYDQSSSGIWWSGLPNSGGATNVGKAWKQSNITAGSWYILGESDTGRIFASCISDLNYKGIWYSDDQGKTWSQSQLTIGSYCSFINLGNNTLLIGGHINGLSETASRGIWRSTDNGATWTQLVDSTACKACHSFYKQGNRLYGVGAWKQNSSDTQYGLGVKYSDDNGNTWNDVLSIVTNKQYDYIYSLNNSLILTVIPDSFLTQSTIPQHSEEVPVKHAREKYLDQNGAQELITQFKAYCDAKVGA